MDDKEQLEYLDEEMLDESEQIDSFDVEEEVPQVQHVDNMASLNAYKEGFEAKRQLLIVMADKIKEEYAKVSAGNDEYKNITLKHLRNIAQGLSKLYKFNQQNIKTNEGAITIAKIGPANPKVISTCNEYLKSEAEKLYKKVKVFHKKLENVDPYVVDKLREIEQFINKSLAIVNNYDSDKIREYVDSCIEQKQQNNNRK